MRHAFIIRPRLTHIVYDHQLVNQNEVFGEFIVFELNKGSSASGRIKIPCGTKMSQYLAVDNSLWQHNQQGMNKLNK